MSYVFEKILGGEMSGWLVLGGNTLSSDTAKMELNWIWRRRECRINTQVMQQKGWQTV